MEAVTTQIPRHPAKFSKPIVEQIVEILDLYVEPDARILDPFAGSGVVHTLGYDSVGVEIQPEWAAADPRTIVGDATALPPEWTGSFDAVVTSPCYGNRMADSFQASDDSKRNTYTHALRESGVEPVDSPTNAVKMQWGPEYRRLHERAWDEAVRVVRPGGLLVVNVSNHYRTRNGEQVEQQVVEWHAYQFIARRCFLLEARRVRTQRLGFGANGQTRVDGEVVLVFRTKDAPSWA